MQTAPWIFPTLSGTRWAPVGLDALARAEFPDVSAENRLNDPWFCDAWVGRVATRLGVDRWLMMLAAWRETCGACCVVSAGTALTFDAIDARGRHQGGFIAPGLAAMLKATLGNTRFATSELGAHYTGGLGADTEACVRQGAYLAGLGAIERGIAAAGVQGRRHICGGDAPLLLPHLAGEWRHRADLVLEGLLAWAEASD